jgi:hypothetical protein
METKSANNEAVDRLRIISQRSPKETFRLGVEQYGDICLCSTCKARGFILAPDEDNMTEKNFIEECPDCNS